MLQAETLDRVKVEALSVRRLRSHFTDNTLSPLEVRCTGLKVRSIRTACIADEQR